MGGKVYLVAPHRPFPVRCSETANSPDSKLKYLSKRALRATYKVRSKEVCFGSQRRIRPLTICIKIIPKQHGMLNMYTELRNC